MSNPRNTRRYGWKRQLPDQRDFQYRQHFLLRGNFPEAVDLRPYCPSPYSQGTLGSCTAQACAALAEFLMMKQGRKSFIPSRLFIYYNERLLEGTVGIDAGAELRSGMKVMNQYGCPHEALWWYNVKKFAVKPNLKVYADGGLTKIGEYLAVQQTEQELKSCLIEGFPILFGFSVYESFQTGQVMRTGIVPLPNPKETLLGGHAVMLVGYNNSKRHYIIRNSWGPAWGDHGYFYMPFEYIHNENLSADFWTARNIL